jgi:hypothetical protein
LPARGIRRRHISFRYQIRRRAHCAAPP